jgi:hypothetical protein
MIALLASPRGPGRHYLRASPTVIAERAGRVVRYPLASTPVTALLAGQ